jgi:phenylalanyl-tRNA synthetase alpha chain
VSLTEKINELRTRFSEDVAGISSGELSFENVRVKYLGRKGLIVGLFSQIGSVSNEDRPALGSQLNSLKSEISKQLENHVPGSDDSGPSVLSMDYTLPGTPSLSGTIHPLTQVMDDIKSIFKQIGFSLVYGPEVDTDFYNFEALNIPKHHPARDMQDTFYLSPETLLRTHTSCSQIHFMKDHKPPVRIISPGRVYRNEDISVRSYCLFHQIEGLYVDKNVTFADLKGTLDYFAKQLYGKDVKTRFRPSYFPFTEPSAEMDVSCIFCKGEGCNICKYAGWLEILGCGMVDPEVFKSVDYDFELWNGYAFGMGIERIAMLKYGVKDIRMFYEGDVRFLDQF